jgi:hypothetical protein
MAYRPRTKQVSDADVPGEGKAPLLKVSYNRQLKLSQIGPRMDPVGNPTLLRKRSDEYFDNTQYPTFTGLAIALGFHSVKAWEQTMADYALVVAKHGPEHAKDEADKLWIWEYSRSRVQLHYEEGIQSQEIPAQVGKFVLEVLGFQPAQVVEQKVAGAQAAAEAVRSGFAQATEQYLKSGKQGKGLARDVNAALQ